MPSGLSLRLRKVHAKRLFSKMIIKGELHLHLQLTGVICFAVVFRVLLSTCME